MMVFSFEQISLSNLIIGDFNALTFSVFGISLVFSGLIVISLYVLLLPRLLQLFAKKTVSSPLAASADIAGEDPDEKEILLAISAAFYLHRNFPEEDQKITWKSHGDVDSLWQISGRVQGMSQRTHVSRRFFPHR